MIIYIFFFQAEDGIRDYKVTGVQTCALPIFLTVEAPLPIAAGTAGYHVEVRYDGQRVFTTDLEVLAAAGATQAQYRTHYGSYKIGRAACRERVVIAGGAVRAKADGRLGTVRL